MKKYVNQDDALELLEDIQSAGYYIQLYNNGDYFVNRFTKRTEHYQRVNNNLAR